ncbi:MAG TPA: FAD-dependent oxidoreductase, partial [Corynebacterium sp.]|nr:FAD-dependent oxidoreductase [Corynebacterium sp.]
MEPTRYAIIGAGLAGLTSAYEIRKVDPKAVIHVFEAEDRIGGKLFTVPFDSGPTDMGAEAYLALRSDATDFFTELGLADDLVSPSGLRSLVYSDGELRGLPAGGVMGIPSSSGPVEHVVSAETAARIDAESDAPSIDWEVGGDVSVGKLVSERYGAEVTDRIVSALLGGVYSCAAEDLGVRATVPQLAEALD